MTEIQEMAQAIHEKHKALWPLTWAVADFMSKQLAGDQGYLIVNQLTHELMGLNTEPVEPAPAQDERVAFEAEARKRLYVLDREAISGEYIVPDTENAWQLWQARATRPAQTEQQPVAWADAQQLKALVRDYSASCAVWNSQGRSRVPLYAAPIAQTAPQPEQSGSLNMEPEGANAYLVVDPEDNYHVCYVVRSKDQALQHATDGLLAFGPIT